MSIHTCLTYLLINLVFLQATCLAQLVYINVYAGYAMAIALLFLGILTISHGFFQGGLCLLAESSYGCIHLVLALVLAKNPLLESLPVGWLLFLFFFLKGGSLIFWGTAWNDLDNGVLLIAAGLVSLGIGIFIISTWPNVTYISYYRSLAITFLAELFAFSVLRRDMEVHRN